MRVQAKVKEVVQETPKVRLVRFEFEGMSSFKFRPGQWVGIFSEGCRGENGKPIRRAFSIASSPGDSKFELCVARGKNFSAFLQDSEVGDEFTMDGPFGSFWIKPEHDNLLFIAGGTGIAPIKPMIYDALNKNKKVTLVFSMKSPSDFIYREEIEKLQDNSNFTLIPTITVPEEFPVWSGKRGRVQQFLKDVVKEGMAAYLCGAPQMIEDVALHLEEAGIPKDRILMDKWA